jgi:hypothetical protein
MFSVLATPQREPSAGRINIIKFTGKSINNDDTPVFRLRRNPPLSRGDYSSLERLRDDGFFRQSPVGDSDGVCINSLRDTLFNTGIAPDKSSKIRLIATSALLFFRLLAMTDGYRFLKASMEFVRAVSSIPRWKTTRRKL